MPRYETVLGVRLPEDVARELAKGARADDRALSPFVRRLLTRYVAAPPVEKEEETNVLVAD